MHRRQFISALPKAAAAGAMAGVLPRAHAEPVSWQQQFAAALEEKPWLLAFRTADREAYQSPASLQGRIPPGLQGTFYRNGPARHEVGAYRYHHWFDGDGMLQAYRLNADGVTHQARMIATHKYLAEKDAGRALYPGFASTPPDPQPVTSANQVNVGNISVLAHNNQLYALWEAGSAWEMNPQTLETEGLKVYSAETEGLPFSAHPRVEPDGTLWNFGYVSSAGLMVFWHIDPRGRLKNVGTVPVSPMGMPHDFVVTVRHLVLLIPPMHFEPDGATSFLDAHRWHPERPARVLVVDKNDFSSYRFFELPAQWVFHYGNAWEDEGGVIRFDGARAEDPTAMIDSFRQVMRGADPTPSTSAYFEYRIDTRSGRISESALLSPHIDAEFPSVDPRVSCHQHQRLVMMTSDQTEPAPHALLNSVSVYDMRRDRIETFRYPDNLIPEEHLFAPKPGSAPETDGWVIGSALNYDTQQTELRIFDVMHIDSGPLATATLPYALPLGLHGRFVT